MKAYVFLCDWATEEECLKRPLLATGRDPKVLAELRQIVPGDCSFLYNYSTRLLRGPYTALTRLTENLVPDAFKSDLHPHGFPWQVSVSNQNAFDTPLAADEWRGVLSSFRPPPRLDDTQLDDLLKLFEAKAGPNGPEVSRSVGVRVCKPDDPVGTSFIFKCDHVTGADCFYRNVMGAPVTLLQSVVRKVQPGATVFLWEIQKRRLYGVWRARSRGQYDPTAFPDAPELRLHAVVHCDRPMKSDHGLDEVTVRAIVPYGMDEKMPPYIISSDQAQKLIAELERRNSSDEMGGLEGLETPDGVQEYLANDGHRVRSQGELIIDNMLFASEIPHVYEKRVQVNGQFLRCDFYLPPSGTRREVYVEYWGGIGQPEYDARREEKLCLYRAAGITPLELFPRDLTVLPEVWPAKIRLYNVSC